MQKIKTFTKFNTLKNAQLHQLELKYILRDRV